ncbi:YdeI/OmpD-associated family protein [Niabella sp.]|uniref:YdeI/OmpD-associated family protein n=1 Tax=Niabella sp. TaxID=1962976 RepID=UPI002603670A|nr:YdeI/OmpD-associated family protein [Niabella sp.]
MEKPLVCDIYLLKRIPGKGGWTYAEIPEIAPDKQAPFGWVRVKGSVDGMAFQHYRLQPMGNGRLFFPLKAEIRKKIKKEAGDFVKLILYKDDTPLTIPEELIECMKDVPGSYEKFLQLSEGKQQQWISWVYTPKTAIVKAKRILSMIDELMQGSGRK